MSTVDDLLNAIDSDEDVDTTNVDLENLLNDGSDDSDDDYIAPVGINASKASKLTVDDILSDVGSPTAETTQRHDEPLNEQLVSLSQRPSTSALNDPATDSDDEDIHISARGGSSLEEKSIPAEAMFPDQVGLLGALDMARRREHRNVMSGNRDVVSALHAKLLSESSNAALSHIKASELEALSSQLRRNAQFKQHGPGVATVLFVHLKFIAIGTSRGLILLFDHFQEIRQVIGSNTNTAAQTVKTNAAVTSIDSTTAADVLVAGYDNGEVLLWDVPKGVILKRLTELHRMRVVRLKLIIPIGDGSGVLATGTNSSGGMVGNLLGSHSGSAGSHDVSVITVDTEGVVHRAKFSKMIWTSYTIETDCLLDGKTGSVVDLSVLPPVPTVSRYTSAATALLVAQAGGKSKAAANEPEISPFPLHAHTEWAALATCTKTYIIQVQPAIKILHRWSPPVPVKDIPTPVVVSLDWLWHPVDVSEGAMARRAKINKLIEKIDAEEGDAPSEPPAASDEEDDGNQVTVYPILARTWGPHVQLITCFSKARRKQNDGTGGNEDDPTAMTRGDIISSQPVEGVGFFEISSRTLDDNIVTAKWLSLDSMKLVLLTATNMLVLDASRAELETVEMMQLSPTIVSSISDNFPKNRLDEGLLTTGCSSNDSFFLLTASELYNFTLQSWVEQVEVMIKEGKWLDALAKVLQETKLKKSGVPTHRDAVSEQLYLMDPEEEYLDAKTQKENEIIDGFLKRYLNVAINKQQVGGYVSGSTSLGLSGSSSGLRNQYHLVAGVCIEYCVNANRLRYLFTDVFSAFVNARQDAHFLDALEPFILNRRIRWLPPKIIGSLFEMSARSHRLAALERLIVHLDLSYNVDIHFVIKFLHVHKMSSAYLYGYASGLGDCAGAFHSLFTARLLQSEGGDEEAKKKVAGCDRENAEALATACGYPSSEQAEVGYRLFMFLECVGKGIIFPRDEKIEPPPSVDVLWRLIELVVSEKYVSHISVSFGEKEDKLEQKAFFSLEDVLYPYLYALFRVDANALFAVISESIQCISSNAVPHARQRSGSVSAPTDKTAQGDSTTEHLECSVAHILHHCFMFVVHLCDDYHVHYEVAQRPFFEQCLHSIVNCKEILPSDLLRSTVQYINTHVKPRLLAEEMAAHLAQAQSKLMQPNAVHKNEINANNENKVVYPLLRGMLEEQRFYRSSLYICFWKHRYGNGARVFGSGLRYYLTMALRSGGVGRESAGELATVRSPQSSSVIDVDEGEDSLFSAVNPLSTLQKGEFGTQFEQPFLYIEDQFRVLYTEEEESSVVASYAGVVIGALPELYDLDKDRTRLLATTHLLSFVSELCLNLKKYPTLLFDVLFAMFVVASGSENDAQILDGNGGGGSGRRTSMIAVNTKDFNRRGSMIIAAPESPGQVSGTVSTSNSSASYFSHANMLVFLKLVATLQPRSLYGVLCSTENYSLDDAIILCRERRVFDSSSYLLERVGDITGALDVALNEFTNCCSRLGSDVAVLMAQNNSAIGGNLSVLSSPMELAYFKKAMGTALKAMETSDSSVPVTSSTSISSVAHISGTTAGPPSRERTQSGGVISTAGTGAHTAALELLDTLVKLPSFSDAVYALNFSMRLCATHSSKVNHTMWFKVLDHTLGERAKHQVTSSAKSSIKKPPSEEYITDEICSSFVGELIQCLMSRMLATGGVNPQDIVRRITQEQAMRGSRFSEFKEVFIGMVESHSFELFMYETVVQLHTQDLSSLQRKRIQAKRSAVRVDPNKPKGDVGDDESPEVAIESKLQPIDESGGSKHRARKPKHVNNLRRFKSSMERIALLEQAMKGNAAGTHGLNLAPKEVNDITVRSATIGRRKPGSLPVQAVYNAAMDDGFF